MSVHKCAKQITIQSKLIGHELKIIYRKVINPRRCGWWLIYDNKGYGITNIEMINNCPWCGVALE